MIIDASHRRWAIATAVILAAALMVYGASAARSSGPAGGTAVGLTLGIAGFACMLFVTLLSVRKKFPIWRIGRAQTWMRGHLWLGALTLPLILLHAGLGFGHGLTAVLMWLFVIVYASGLYGAWIQHTMPRRILRHVPMETIYEQIAHVRSQLVDEADTLVAAASGKLEVAVPVAASGAVELATVMRVDADDAAPLREFYLKEVRPFLSAPTSAHPMADASIARGRLEKMKSLLPASLHPPLIDLENICEEERQLLQQERMHGILHVWLLVHVPLSFALMALAIVHIIAALRY
jgi:hypothetical protein